MIGWCWQAFVLHPRNQVKCTDVGGGGINSRQARKILAAFSIRRTIGLTLREQSEALEEQCSNAGTPGAPRNGKRIVTVSIKHSGISSGIEKKFAGLELDTGRREHEWRAA